MNLQKYSNVGRSIPRVLLQPSVDTVEVGPESGEAGTQVDQWLEDRGLDPQDHGLMRQNLLTYLAHSQAGHPQQRWQNKIDRDLADPYTDRDVFEHIDRLEDSLQENLKALPKMPSKLYLSGSFAKGRLGGNSDLDGYAVVETGHMERGFTLFVEREKLGDGTNLLPVSTDSPGLNRAHLMLAGQTVEITPAQAMTDGFLKRIYQDICRSRDQRLESHLLFELALQTVWNEELSGEDKREAFGETTLRARFQNAVLGLGGTLAGVPLIGGAVRWAADACIAQNHRDYTAMSIGPGPQFPNSGGHAILDSDSVTHPAGSGGAEELS